MAEDHFVRDREITLARTRLWLEVDAIKAAGHFAIAQYAEDIAGLLADSGRCSRAEARVATAALVHALIASVVNWYEDGAASPWAEYGHRALDLVESRLGSI